MSKSPAQEVVTGIAILVAVLVVVVGGLSFLIYQLNAYDSSDGGHVAVIRNGGPLDNTKIIGVLPPSSGRTGIGFLSVTHQYPTSQRYFKISSDGKGDSDQSIVVPTADGVQVGIEGTAYFTVNTDAVNSYAVLKDFDNKYGTRTFRCSNGERHAVWDGDTGMSCFLDQMVGPIIANDLRVAIGSLRCADLVASCALVQNNTTSSIDPNLIGQGNVNLAKIEQQISTTLQQDLSATLQGNYLTGVRFNLATIDLPAQVQTAITDAQSQFALVTKAQADQKQALIQANTRLQQAKLDAQANAEREKGYQNCKTCQQIDVLKSLPQGITVYAPGGSGLGLAVPAK